MTTLNGITEGGTSVPVQVTDDGRIVAQGLTGGTGPQGPEGPQGQEGPQGPAGEYGPGDDVQLGSATFASTLKVEGSNIPVGLWSGISKYGSLLIGTSSEITADARASVDSGNGSATFAGSVDLGENQATSPELHIHRGSDDTTQSNKLSWNQLELIRSGTAITSDQTSFTIKQTGSDGSRDCLRINEDGSSSFAVNKCGFTSEGEIYMTSRGTRYKLVVAGGLVNAEPYTRAMELREKAEQLRQPKTTDIVLPDE